LAAKAAGGIDLQEEKRPEREEGVRARQSTLRAFLDNRYEPWAKVHLKTFNFQLKRLRSDFEDWLDKPMQDFNQFAVEGLRQKWRKGGLQPRSINRDVQRLSSVLSRAVESGVLNHHPLKGMKQLKYDKRRVPRFLSPAELAVLRTALTDRETNMRAERLRMNEHRAARGKKPLPLHDGEFVDYLRAMVLVSFNGGLRRGELFNLPWSNVNFVAGILEVEGDENEDGGTGSKSGHSRVVPMNVELKTVLSAWHEQHGCPAKGLVFPNPETGERFTRIDKSWGGVRKAAGIAKIKFHHLRHTFASRLVQAGVPLNTVRELMGHEDIETTMIYAHLAPNNLRAAVEQVAG
jgi:integrase